MHGFWSFDTSVPAKRQRLAVVFCFLAEPRDEDLRDCIERHCEQKPPPEHVLLVAPISEKEAITRAIDSPMFREHLASVTRYRSTPEVSLFLFDERGELFDRTGKQQESRDTTRMRRIGLTLLAQRALLVGSPWLHYEIPSKKHAPRFIRLGNAMVDGGAIDFIAFCCLPFIAPNLKYIYCDTGTISPVAYAVNNLRQRINKECRSIAVDSFGSYDGAKTFQFREPEQAVILVSVTSGGGLAPYLCKLDPNIPPSSVVTLFSFCETPGFTSVVCDLRHDAQENPGGFDTFPIFDSIDCPLCRRGSGVIRISGEQLLPGSPKVDSIVLRAGDAPPWLWPFLRAAVGTTLIHANYQSPGTRHAAKDIYLDLEGMFEEARMLGLGRYRERLQWMVCQAVPAQTCRIICLDSPASLAMAQMIKHMMGERMKDLPIMTYSYVVRTFGEVNHVSDSGATLVVAAAVASGRSIMAAAQLLRHIQKNGAVTYLIGFARTPSREASQEIQGNVSYGERPNDHGYHLLDEVYLPLLGSHTRTSWDEEVELLNGLAVRADETLKPILEARIRDVNEGASERHRGLVNNLFWSRVDGDALRLRRGFVFFDFDHREETSQADVLFTITAVLHRLRCLRDSERSLFQHEHSRKVLSPLCFDRFNDGIIQAALLRAAVPVELDYSVSDQLSGEMAMFLDFILANALNEPGEAAREFLLALALDRLRLRRQDLEELLNRHAKAMTDPVCRILWQNIPIGT